MSRPSENRLNVPGPSPLRRSLPSVRLILHWAPGKGLMEVVRAIMSLTRFHRDEATLKMWQTYHEGRTHVLTTHRERGELFVEQFGALGLTASLEPA